MSKVITTKSDAVHPFVPVTTTLYVPAASIVGVAVLSPDTICPPLDAFHRYVPPPLPVNCKLVIVQVSVPGAVPASAAGGVVFCETTTLSVAVQIP